MSRKQILTFIAMGIGVGVIAVDIAAINVALPEVEKDFQTTIGVVEWVVNGYALSFGVLMVTCGRLADTFGRRKIFYMGVVVFGLASLAGGLAWSPEVLIGARVVQGVGAALLWPAILGIVYSSVSDEKKGFAVGLILGAAGVGNAAGPLIGGGITEILSWRWVLFVNVPLALTAGVLTYFNVDEQLPEKGEKKVDYLGIITISVSLVALLYALNQSPSWGWESYKTISLLIVFIVFLLIFIPIERRTEEALIPKDVMHNFPFMINATIMFTVIPAFFGMLLYIPQYLEKFKGYSPLGAGAALVPMLLMFAIFAPLSGTIYNRLGAKLSITIGMTLTAVGTIAMALFGFGGSYIHSFPALVITGIGLGFSVPSITTAAVGAVRESRTSLAGGIVYMFQLVGGALGLAVITTIFTDVAREDITSSLQTVGMSISEGNKSDILGFVLGSSGKERLISDFGQVQFGELLPHIHHAYVTGIKMGLWFAAILAAAGAVLAILFVSSRKSQSV